MSSRKPPFQHGLVSLEFILIFPLIVGLLYAGLVYGMLFFHKVELQRAVDAASSAVYSLDRREHTNYSDKVTDHSKDVLDKMVASLPERIRNPESCGSDEADTGSPFLPQLSIGPLGDFPPQPKCLKAVAAVTF